MTRKGMETPAGTETRSIQIQYYALLRERRGLSMETLETDAPTPRALYLTLSERYPFPVNWEVMRVAVNNRFQDWDTPLQTGDSVVFIPPVAGG